MSENNGTILQNLRDFTVQIRRPNSETIVGTGIAVSLDGRIITCAHVVRETIGVHPRQAGERPVGVYFLQARGDESKARQATAARQEAQRARTLSTEMGYHWRLVAVEEWDG